MTVFAIMGDGYEFGGQGLRGFKDDEKKAKVLSEVIDELESRIAPLRDVATKGDLEVTKLALQKEIE